MQLIFKWIQSQFNNEAPGPLLMNIQAVTMKYNDYDHVNTKRHFVLTTEESWWFLCETLVIWAGAEGW